MKRLQLLTVICLLALAVACKRPEYQTGEAVYKGECQKCHKLNGVGGKKGPELTGILDKKDEQLVRTHIMDPRSVKPDGIMPPAKMSDKELNLVVEYLREASRKHN